MKEKERVINGEEEAKRMRGPIYDGLKWVMIILIGEKLLWRAAHEENACPSKATSGGWDAASLFGQNQSSRREANLYMSQTLQTKQTEAYPVEDYQHCLHIKLYSYSIIITMHIMIRINVNELSSYYGIKTPPHPHLSNSSM